MAMVMIRLGTLGMVFQQKQVVEVKAFGKDVLLPSAAAGYWTSALAAEGLAITVCIYTISITITLSTVEKGNLHSHFEKCQEHSRHSQTSLPFPLVRAII